MGENGIPEPIYRLAQQIKALQEEAERLGLFLNDRDLITCPRCGLREDVDVNGKLLTCRPGSLGVDTGLSFEELLDSGKSRFRCPSCGMEVKLEDKEGL